MQQRYYDPQIGRFLSVDPVGVDQANGFNFNRNWYAGNNPYKFTDPDGRCFWDLCAAETYVVIIVGGAIIAGGVYATKQLSDAIGNATGVYNEGAEAPPADDSGSGRAGSEKEPIPGAVDLVDDLAGQEVNGQIQAGEGKVLPGMGDKKFDPATGTHDKVAKSRDNADGTQTEVHADRNRQTGETENVRIKQQGPNCRQAAGCGE